MHASVTLVLLSVGLPEELPQLCRPVDVLPAAAGHVVGDDVGLQAGLVEAAPQVPSQQEQSPFCYIFLLGNFFHDFEGFLLNFHRV